MNVKFETSDADYPINSSTTEGKLCLEPELASKGRALELLNSIFQWEDHIVEQRDPHILNQHQKLHLGRGI